MIRGTYDFSEHFVRVQIVHSHNSILITTNQLCLKMEICLYMPIIVLYRNVVGLLDLGVRWLYWLELFLSILVDNQEHYNRINMNGLLMCMLYG